LLWLFLCGSAVGVHTAVEAPHVALLLLLLLQVGLEVVVLCCAIKPLCAWNAETCATTSR
jgi:hypothetical protein